MPFSALISRRACLLAVAGSVIGCGPSDEKIELTENEIELAQSRSIDALKQLGCRVEEVQDELIGTAGILLRLSPEHFSDTGLILPAIFQELRYLRTCFLVADSTPISAAGLGELRTLKNLLLLSVQRTGIGDAGLEQIQGIISVKLLRLNATDVSDSGLRHISRLPNLVMLYLSQTRITDKAFEHIVALRDLRALQLTGTAISDRGVERLIELPKLEFVGLKQTAVSDAGVAPLHRLKKLKFLDLTATKVSAEAIKSLQQQLPECEIVKEFSIGG